MRNQKNVFEEIYQKERWGKGKGSGTGSDPSYCVDYLEWLKIFLVEKHIKKIVDVGCGDWQLYKDFDWSRYAYHGLDISSIALSIARHNSHLFRQRPVFRVIENQDEALVYIKEVKPDLVLLKDVMMHWTDEEQEYFLSKLAKLKWKYVVTANNWKYVRDPSKNNEPRKLDAKYSWAPIPLDHPPMVKFGFKPLFRYPRGGYKQVMIAKYFPS